jgi:hypothetical protein
VEAQRTAIVFERFEFDGLISSEHVARRVWAWDCQEFRVGRA